MPDLESNDAATPVRAGEELPIAPLAAYLSAHLPDADFPDGEITVTQFASGYSNLTYLIRSGQHETGQHETGQHETGRHEIVLRRPPIGANIATAHDMGREVRVLTGLRRVYEYVPRVLLYCQDTQVIGAPFYLMERLHGVVLRSPLPSDSAPIPPDVMARLATNVIDNLAAIHALDYHAAGLAELGKPAGYLARQVQGWNKRYQAAQTDTLPDLERALSWLAEHQPVEVVSAGLHPAGGAALIHNDYKYDNLMLDRADLTRLVAVLDWEMCTLGDPLLDLGTTLGYWMEPNDPPALVEMFGLTTLPGNPNRAEVVERYGAASGCRPFDPLFPYVYGVAKIGVILQQIYHRYRLGQSQNARFARLGDAVAACGLMASEAIRTGRISGLF
jgi:aminoglycoside phosphotransferase (APT) family kinase protein